MQFIWELLIKITKPFQSLFKSDSFNSYFL